MRKDTIILLAALFAAIMSKGETIRINNIYPLSAQTVAGYVALGDTTGVNTEFDVLTGNTGNVRTEAAAYFENRKYTKANIRIDGVQGFKATLDGKPFEGGETALHPGTHTLKIRYMTEADSRRKPEVEITTAADGAVRQVETDSKHIITLDDILYGLRVTGGEISPSGEYVIADYAETLPEGGRTTYQMLHSLKDGTHSYRLAEKAQWMPKSDKYMTERTDYLHGRHIVAIDPLSHQEEILATHLPEGEYQMSPTEDYLVYRMVRKGPKEDKDIYRIIEPDDRQAGWRDRSYPAVYDIKSGVLRPVAMGKEDIDVLDISDDGTKLLLLTSTRRLTGRPTTLYSIVSLDLTTMQADTIVDRDGFIGDACFSPDSRQVLVKASPEAFGRIGCTLPKKVTPSTYDYQLYLIDTKDKSIRPLTRDFDPSLRKALWSRSDNKIYLNTTDQDMYRLYRLDPTTGKITLIDLPKDVIGGMSIARTKPTIAFWGQSDSTFDALYAANMENGTVTLLADPGASLLEAVKMPPCHDWTFKTSRGDTVKGLYFLPDDFDPSKRYPLIVNYYGGCNPSTRTFECRYPLHVYAALGYVVLQLQPSGCTGFGQEWSSRHVSTAGKGVAEDIIEGTKQFCKEMAYVDPGKIGCIGASYGGFMTQYLQTVTDIFAAAVSHAGISDHTSYWGEGFWGYSYSETSMGDDLPWSAPDLYVKQSPLYNADKVHTPILFLHGDHDTNVPVGESIQMFTALQRLGRESALVQVADQNHQILDPEKRKKWQDTIFAWFAKYLQDDPTWWDAMYERKF